MRGQVSVSCGSKPFETHTHTKGRRKGHAGAFPLPSPLAGNFPPVVALRVWRGQSRGPFQFELRLLATFSASNSHGLGSAQKGGKGTRGHVRVSLPLFPPLLVLLQFAEFRIASFCFKTFLKSTPVVFLGPSMSDDILFVFFVVEGRRALSSAILLRFYFLAQGNSSTSPELVRLHVEALSRRSSRDSGDEIIHLGHFWSSFVAWNVRATRQRLLFCFFWATFS